MLKTNIESILPLIIEKDLNNLPSRSKRVYNTNTKTYTVNGFLYCIGMKGSHKDLNSSALVEKHTSIFILASEHTRIFIQNDPSVYARPHQMSRLDVSNWIQTSDHETSWKTEGIRSPLLSVYFKIGGDINDELFYIGCRTVEFAYIEMLSNITAISEPVHITYKDLDELDSYHKQVVSVTLGHI